MYDTWSDRSLGKVYHNNDNSHVLKYMYDTWSERSLGKVYHNNDNRIMFLNTCMTRGLTDV